MEDDVEHQSVGRCEAPHFFFVSSYINKTDTISLSLLK